MSEILYHDSQVTIYRELVLIKKYYFPLATSRTILIPEIERVTLNSAEGVDHRWGICGKFLNNWFPYDSERKGKDKFIEIILKGKKTRPSFTPDDPDKAFKVIWENFTLEGRAFSEHASHASDAQDGQDTDLAREEMMKEQAMLETTENHLSKPVHVEVVEVHVENVDE
jgi:hypothetical protein